VWDDDEVGALDRYVDLLNGGSTNATMAFLRPGLLDLARQLKTLLLPVEPTSLFRASLHDQLVAAARASLITPRPSWPSQHRRGLLIGATVGSLLSVAGAVALAVRLRGTPRRAA